MKTSYKTANHKIRYILLMLMLIGFAVAFVASPVAAQVSGKNKKNDKIPQGTLKEAKVTARVITSVEEISPMRVKVNVLNPTGKQVRIAIRNYANIPLFQDSFTGKEYNKILNFTQTPMGRYSLVVAGHKQTDVKRFAINSKENRNMTPTDLENRRPSDVMAAIYKSAPAQITLHVVNNTGEPLNYIFRNNEKDILYQGVIRNTQFTKFFDLAAVTDGKYTFEVNYLTDKAASRSFDIKTVYDRSFAWTDKRGRPLKPVGALPMTRRNMN
ncbi:hypothetical protein [Adhaeribacter rhizoryzae]|uniref:Uncharacterized protein n=1 Tax=Adhaeribacter rhizoryzae TaxID=2607907 RepID=A0A5M6DP05_9BACT|nr:hypothetical protein [Adhaeribacter rhizoryzae]KAA5549218.1 hypothetical protein F0145_01090 [Adhaeribacter rhizoryzae]